MQLASQPAMHCRALIRRAAFVATLIYALCAPVRHLQAAVADRDSPRAQLSIGYSLLYQEADGIPKLKWILMFKDKPEEMGRITTELLSYYQQLADRMQSLAKQYPAMRIDATTMPKIEADTRKAMGQTLAKEMAPLTGDSGTEFEREALLMFSNSLDEQRHLTGVMLDLETAPPLKKFLTTTHAELQERYGKVEALLKRRYFAK